MNWLGQLFRKLIGDSNKAPVSKDDTVLYMQYLFARREELRGSHSVRRAMVRHVGVNISSPAVLTKSLQAAYRIIREDGSIVPDSWKGRDRSFKTLTLDSYLTLKEKDKAVYAVAPEEWISMVEPICKKISTKLIGMKDLEAKQYYTEWYADLFKDVITILEELEVCLVQ